MNTNVTKYKYRFEIYFFPVKVIMFYMLNHLITFSSLQKIFRDILNEIKCKLYKYMFIHIFYLSQQYQSLLCIGQYSYTLFFNNENKNTYTTINK